MEEAVAEAEEMSDPEEREIGAEEGGDEGEEDRDHTKWQMVVKLVQTDFRDGVFEEESKWQAAVLIPKGGCE